MGQTISRSKARKQQQMFIKKKQIFEQKFKTVNKTVKVQQLWCANGSVCELPVGVTWDKYTEQNINDTSPIIENLITIEEAQEEFDNVQDTYAEIQQNIHICQDEISSINREKNGFIPKIKRCGEICVDERARVIKDNNCQSGKCYKCSPHETNHSVGNLKENLHVRNELAYTDGYIKQHCEVDTEIFDEEECYNRWNKRIKTPGSYTSHPDTAPRHWIRNNENKPCKNHACTPGKKDNWSSPAQQPKPSITCKDLPSDLCGSNGTCRDHLDNSDIKMGVQCACNSSWYGTFCDHEEKNRNANIDDGH